jgi:outer membrane protein assembly factor BamA
MHSFSRYGFSLLLVLLLLAPVSLSGQQSRVDSILVRLKMDPARPQLEDSTSPQVFVDTIVMEGNATTRRRIILREVVFSEGDSLTLNSLFAAMEESRENLLNTALFNFVEFHVDYAAFPRVKVNILFVERWYVWPFPILELGDRNINEWLANPGLSRMNYGMYLVWENFRGRRENISLLLKTGYRNLYKLTYNKPYFNARQTFGWGLEAAYSSSHELAYMTLGNRQQFVKLDDQFVFHNSYVSAELNYRPAFRNMHALRLGYNFFHFADTLLALNPRFSLGERTELGFLSLSWEFKNDFRDLRAYPRKGHYFDVRLSRHGLGLLKDELMDITTLETSYRKYWELAPRWFFAAGGNAKLSQGKTNVYFSQQGLGFLGDLVRGYENFVIDGQHFLVLKSNLKFALVPQRTGRIGFLPGERFQLIHYAFYLNLFADAGYVDDRYFFQGNQLNNVWLAGTGLGIDFVTYYDKVFRTEFSVNRHGQAGLFFHVIAPI